MARLGLLYLLCCAAALLGGIIRFGSPAELGPAPHADLMVFLI